MAYASGINLRSWSNNVVQIQNFTYLSIYNIGASDLVLKFALGDSATDSNVVPANGGVWTAPQIVAKIESIYIINASGSNYNIMTDGQIVT
jgi:hypothetical protein